MANVTFSKVVNAGPGYTTVEDDTGNQLTLHGSRNWRNNNPGNIVYGPFAKKHGAIGSDGTFAVFPTEADGDQARYALQFDSPKYKDKSIADAVSAYAPSSENDTPAYIAAVTEAAGVPASTRMGDLTNDQRKAFLDAQKQVEGMKAGKITAADGTEVAASTPAFVNPAASGSIPAPPPFNPLPPPAPLTPANANPSAPALSDDDLLKMFVGNTPKTDQKPNSSAPANDDDAFLKQFLPSDTRETPPADQSKTITQPDLTGFPIFGPIAGAMGYNGQPQPVASGYTPSTVPFLDPVNAFATKALESVPVAGPMLNNLSENLDAGTYNLINRLTGSGAAPITAEDRAKINAGDQAQNPTATQTGQIAGETAPYLALGGMGGIGAKLLGTEGPIAARVAASGLTGATIQGADTLARGGTPQEAATSALQGGVAGAVAPAAAKLVDVGLNKLLSVASPTVAQLAKTAMDKFNIPIEGAQISGNPLVRHAGDIVNKLPGLGGTAARGRQIAAFNGALAKEMGETAETLTPDAMAAARDRIGTQIDDIVSSRVPVVKGDNTLLNDLAKTESDAESSLEASKVAPIKKQIDNILETFKGGQITGDQYLSLINKSSILSKAIAQGGDIGNYASEIKDALYGALQRSAPADAVADLTKARYQWKVMRTLEPLVAKSPTGEISPALLMGQVVNKFGGKAFGQAGNMGELADIGQRLLKEPGSSQTAERGAVGLALEKAMHSPLTAAAGVGSLAIPGVISGLAANAPMIAGGAILSRLAAAGMRSRALTNKLIQNTLAPAASAAATPLSIGARAAVPFVAPRVPVSITVNGGNKLLRAQ